MISFGQYLAEAENLSSLKKQLKDAEAEFKRLLPSASNAPMKEMTDDLNKLRSAVADKTGKRPSNFAAKKR